MICRTCGCGVVFTDDGWHHVDPSLECSRVTVVWPPPGGDEEDDQEDAA
ncbi:hypothetical protein HQ535_07265 [bacterium]|nr:hypothetical protein [bacterium]